LGITSAPSSVPGSSEKADKPRRRYRKCKQPTEDERVKKRTRFLEKNKVAAAKYRMKKKGMEEQLQDNIRMSQASNTVLQTQRAGLLSEVESLKELVSLHGAECNCNISAKEKRR
jgi:Pyruvate/2-oxoacid:ferredoxin oxidoreductase gamma subunit